MLELPEWVLKGMWEHAVREHPKEASGALLYKEGRPGDQYDHDWMVYPMTNVASDPRQYYAWDPEEMVGMFECADRKGMELLVIYHSHPETSPDPSLTDQSGATYPGVHYLIFSTAAGGDEAWYQSYRCPEMGMLVQEEVRLR